MKHATWISVGAVLSSLGVILGAFGAHALKTRIGAEDLLIYESAVRYLTTHSMALIAVGLATKGTSKMLNLAAILFCIGIIIFCGSLFLLITTHIRVFGAITPVGGLCFIIAWLVFALAAYQAR